MRPKCWFIVEPGRRLGSNLGAALQLRGVPAETCTLENPLPDLPGSPGTIVAMNFNSLQRLSAFDRLRLSHLVADGVTLYVGGNASPGVPYSLAPFAPGEFLMDSETETSGYAITSHSMLPAVLRGEHAVGRFVIPIALGLSEAAKPLVAARDHDGFLLPSVFVLEHGNGVVFFDLTDGESGPQCLQQLLENPVTRPSAIAPLIAVERASGRNLSRPASFSIVIDDRPINLDFFNANNLEAFLQGLEQRCPGIHVDFAWTPDQNRPSRRYIQILKQFNTGFVWHGLLHHVDHRGIVDPETDFAIGRRLVEDINRQYGVTFQPVMVFPYEKDSEATLALIRREGFIAKAESVESSTENPEAVANGRRPPDSFHPPFTTLARRPVTALTRDRMLALASLGEPIIVAVHPYEIALRRLAGLRHNGEGSGYLDGILEFAAAKELRLHALQRIAEDQLAKPQLYH